MIKFTDMKSIERQKERLNELLKLCAENPDLPVICSVDSEIVCDDSYGWWLGSIGGGARVDSALTTSDGAIIFRSYEDDNYHYETFFDEDEIDPDATDEEVKEKVDGLPWMRCIVVYIELPDCRIPNRDGEMLAL